MSKEQAYHEIFNLFIDKEVPSDILERYFETDETTELQDFIGLNLKTPFLSWITCLSIIDIADYAYNEAINNGNIK